MKKILLTLALLAPAAATAKILVNGTVKIAGAETSRAITLQDDQTRFHYWTNNGLLLVGQILEQTQDDVTIRLGFGKKSADSNPEDTMVRFDRMISKSVVCVKWGEPATIEIKDGETVALSISVTLSKND